MIGPGKWVWAISTWAFLFAPSPLGAEPPNACIGLFDRKTGDWDSPEAYVNVKISENRSACFLVPRSVMAKEVRDFYAVGRSASLHFEASDLYKYLRGKTAVRVGSEERVLDRERLSCLTSPEPDAISISGGPPSAPLTVEILRSELLAIKRPLKPTTGDLRGYRRYESEREHYYFPDTAADAELSFWCADYWGAKAMCVLQGEYGGMKAFIRFHKMDMERVRPKEALECVRAIGDLFRVDSEKS